MFQELRLGLGRRVALHSRKHIGEAYGAAAVDLIELAQCAGLADFLRIGVPELLAVVGWPIAFAFRFDGYRAKRGLMWL